MKIENKKTSIHIIVEDQKKENLTYAELIKLFIIPTPKQGGYGWEDIENRLAISKAAASANGEMEMESGQLKYLKTLVEKAAWPFMHEDLLQFKEDILTAK